jgi:hypothetical protein
MPAGNFPATALRCAKRLRVVEDEALRLVESRGTGGG